MAAKTKQTKKFNKKHLSHTLKSRKKHQSNVKQAQNQQHRRATKNKSNKKLNQTTHDHHQDDDDNDSVTESKPKFDMSLDALLNPSGNQSYHHSASDRSDQQDESEDEQDEEELDDLDSIASLEDGSNQKIDFEMLKQKDPEFYKFLEENDKGLLEFDEEDETEEDDNNETDDGSNLDDQQQQKTKQSTLKAQEDSSSTSILLTKELLRTWQKAILENRSMRALRKVLLAFKSAAFSSTSDPGSLPFLIESSSVYNAVITTALRFFPVFLNQTLPAKELPNGKFKIATNSKSYSSIQRMLKSYFTSLIELINQIPTQQASTTEDSSVTNTSYKNNNLLHTSVSQSSKLIPWITGNRKLMKSWIKTLLDLWSSSSDSVRLAAVLSLRKLALAADSSTTEFIMKDVYTTLIRSSKNTTVFTLPLINLMKNSGSNMYLTNLDLAYPIVFNYIRQLAIHLRNAMNLKSKEGFQAVYNWQYIHSLDFWSLVISSAYSNEDTSSKSKSASSGALDPLIFPLVQITIGVIKLVPTTRYYPLRFHCLRILLRLIQRTKTFIPLTPFLLEPLDSALFKRPPNLANSKAKPLDFEYILKCPKSHENSKVYADGVADEIVFLLLEYHACLADSMGFPELVLPVLSILKKFNKSYSSHNYRNHQLISQVKTLVQKIESHQDWIKTKRSAIFANTSQGFNLETNPSLLNLSPDELNKSPLISHLTLQSKIRKQKQLALDRSAHHGIEID